MSPIRGAVVTYAFTDVRSFKFRRPPRVDGEDDPVTWIPEGTVTLEVPVTRSTVRHLWRWLHYPDQAPMTSVPVKGRK